jgi:hypothetical protein
MKRPNLNRGIYVSCGLLLFTLIVFVVGAAVGYDGMCGGFFPGLSVRKSCSFWAYVSGDMFVIALILMLTFWPGILAMLVLPPIVGYWFDRRGTHHPDRGTRDA